MIKLLILIRTKWIFATLFILAAITALSLWPLEELPSLPGTDKIHHFIAYAVLMFPAALWKPRHWKLLALLFIAYSGAIELLQPFVNRYSEWLDLAANATGVICGLLIAQLVGYFLSHDDFA